MQGCNAICTLSFDVSTEFDQQAYNVERAGYDCGVQGRRAEFVPRIDLCAVFDQQACNVEGFPLGCLTCPRTCNSLC